MQGPIDISLRLRSNMPTWPGGRGYRRDLTRSMARGDAVTESAIEMGVHCGTHVEAPLHFLDAGASMNDVDVDVLVGPALVVHLPDAHSIGYAELESAVGSRRVDRLLLRTRNSDRWESAVSFDPAYVALTRDGAEWIAERGTRLIGVDYLSVQRYGDDPETHRVLMRSNVIILEGLDLSRATAGEYRLTCLPLSLDGAEAAPARAILEPLR